MKRYHSLLFLHIPKTAGTTLNYIIRQNYHASEIFALGENTQASIREFVALDEANRHKIRLLQGHMAYGLHSYMAPPTTYFTILRDPVERIISYYYFVRRISHHYLHDFVVDNDLSLLEYLDSRQSIMMDNFQTRLVSGVWDRFPFGECPDDILEQAKDNLRKHFAVVGLTEKFDETLLLLKTAFGWRNIYYTSQNVTSNRPAKDNLPEEALAAVLRANQLDVALYAYAQQLFAEQIESLGPGFAASLAQFQAANRYVSPLMRLYWQMRRVSIRAYGRQLTASLNRRSIE